IIGYFVAGWVNEIYGWRATFAVLGIPGLLLAALARASLREPRKTRGGVAPTPPGVRTVVRSLRGNRTFVHLLIAFSVMFFFSYGVWQWVPAFFIRSYGLHTGEIG